MKKTRKKLELRKAIVKPLAPPAAETVVGAVKVPCNDSLFASCGSVPL